MGLEQFTKFASAAADVGSLLGGAGSILGGIGGAFTAVKNRRDARKMQREMMEWQSKENRLAFERNLNMWNNQNAYNSPSAQVQRLLEAGLNPNLAYGSIGAGRADTPPYLQPVNVPAVSEAAFSNPFDSLQSGSVGLTSASSALKNNLLQKAQIKKLEEDTKGSHLDNLQKEIELSTLPSQLKITMLKDVATLNLTKEQNTLVKVQVQQAEIAVEAAKVSVDKLREEYKILKANRKVAEYDSKVHSFFKSEEYRKLRAESDIAASDAKYAEQLIKARLLSMDDAHLLSAESLQSAIYEREKREYFKPKDYHVSAQRYNTESRELGARYWKAEREITKEGHKADYDKARFDKDSSLYYPLQLFNYVEYVLDTACSSILSSLFK